MKTFLKVIGWIAAALIGFVIWHVFPVVQPLVTWGLGAAFAYHVISTIIEETTKRVLWNELLELRQQSNANIERLETIDRKVSLLLRDALEQRRAPQ